MVVSNTGGPSTVYKDVVGISATGSGKTLSFWIPLLMALEEGHDKMTIVVTSLSLLGKQNVASLQQAGISAVAVSAHNASPEIFTVRLTDILIEEYNSSFSYRISRLGGTRPLLCVQRS